MDIFSKIDKEAERTNPLTKFKHIGDGLYICLDTPKYEEGDGFQDFKQIPRGETCQDTSKEAKKRAELFIKYTYIYDMYEHTQKGARMLGKMKELLSQGVNFSLLSPERQKYLVDHFIFRWSIFHQGGFDLDAAWKSGALDNDGEYHWNKYFCRYFQDLMTKDPRGVPAFLCVYTPNDFLKARQDFKLSRQQVEEIIEILPKIPYRAYMLAVLFKHGRISLKIEEIKKINEIAQSYYRQPVPEVFKDFFETYGIDNKPIQEEKGKNKDSIREQIDKLFEETERTI